MTPRHFLLLLLLAAIWGSSFMFMRIAVPQLGPAWMLGVRLFSAALFLLLVTRILSEPLEVRRHWRHFLILGVLNTALPFFAFSWASRELPAAMLAILNSTAPFWGVLVGVVWRGRALTARTLAGLACGMAGVSALVGLGSASGQAVSLLAAGVCLGASLCYGIASNYAEFAEKVPPFSNAHGSLWAAALLITPILLTFPLPTQLSPVPVGAALALGILCSGVAYLLYYHLIATIGAPSTMTVGYLIPLWGVFWGWLFLGERIGWNTLLGAGLILTGTALVTGLRLRSLVRNAPDTTG